MSDFDRRRAAAAVAAGGALGAPARYGLTLLVRGSADRVPWATVLINVTGSFAIGFLLVLLRRRFPDRPYVRPFLVTGFLGAYTTFSTFAVETDLLLKNGHPLAALLYVAVTLVGGMAAVAAGIRLAQ